MALRCCPNLKYPLRVAYRQHVCVQSLYVKLYVRITHVWYDGAGMGGVQ